MNEEQPAETDKYVLPLVVRLERTAPPARTAALETAARAVLTLLGDPRTTRTDGAWHERVRLWEERGIRKVVRRARGAEWRRVQPLEGITLGGEAGEDAGGRGVLGNSGGHGGRGDAGGHGVLGDGGGDGVRGDGGSDEGAAKAGAGEAGDTGGFENAAQVRVFPPVPLDGWPHELARLQVSGTELSDPAPPPPPAAGTPVLWLHPELRMSAGKAMAQAGHGAQLAWWDLTAADRAAWQEAGFPLAVRPARDAAHWRELVGSGRPVVEDAGFTEIAPGPTVAVEWHWPR
ncbi:peptidyl-tRNA hydrolase [Streptomyces sp. NRRL S-1868]|uniref:peptidyl-tRNA hydrolase n=1 Tax=Streptomyces sp. NRRL S-1868 TaxID=1463892 RepID=UPI00068F8C1D|nr:peptidyl-tRNA hydrolase [Streptomyces sp. NRRL S-1868]